MPRELGQIYSSPALFSPAQCSDHPATVCFGNSTGRHCWTKTKANASAWIKMVQMRDLLCPKYAPSRLHPACEEEDARGESPTHTLNNMSSAPSCGHDCQLQSELFSNVYQLLLYPFFIFFKPTHTLLDISIRYSVQCDSS